MRKTHFRLREFRQYKVGSNSVAGIKYLKEEQLVEITKEDGMLINLDIKPGDTATLDSPIAEISVDPTYYLSPEICLSVAKRGKSPVSYELFKKHCHDKAFYLNIEEIFKILKKRGDL